nr:YjcZ family sporulation protein [Sutcliffiella horikoshii]
MHKLYCSLREGGNCMSGGNYGGGFALIVVLFIILIIAGAGALRY